MDAKRLIILVVLALLLFMLITQPAQSAASVHAVIGWLGNGADTIVTFVRNIFA